MGAINFSLDPELVQFLRKQLPLGLFVETGAYLGDSIDVARQFFPDCRSVEMSPKLYERTRARFAGINNVKLEQGDSGAFFQRHREEFAAAAALFWLDAHWCEADSTSGKESQSPLLAELAALGTLHADSVVMVDDARLYLAPPPHPHRSKDWPDFSAVLQALSSLSSSHRLMVLNDVLLFYPSRIAPAMLEFARQHGTDWGLLAHNLRGHEERERERRLKRSSFFKFFTRFGQQPPGKISDHAAS
jgi:hypothetical protein